MGDEFAILAGRFQPYHNGHHALIEASLARLPNPLVLAVLASHLPLDVDPASESFAGEAAAHHAASRNPFSLWDRLELLSFVWRRQIAEGRMRVLPLPRPQGPPIWWEFVTSFLPPRSHRVWVVPLSGEPWDESKVMFFESVGERVIRISAPTIVRGTEIRERLKSDLPISDVVPPVVSEWLRRTNS